MTNLPRLYVNDKFARIVHPISVGITQMIEPLSTATITLPKGEELPARSYVELFTPYGSAGMFRVRSPRNAYGEEVSSAELEHMIAEVGDYLVKDEISDMRSASSAVSTVFSYYRGNHWQLGSYSAIGNGTVALEAKYDSVLNVLLDILDQKPDCMMTFDFSTTPWRVNIVKRGTSVVAEGRLSRNVSSAMVTYDDSELTTRVWYQTFSHDDEGKINNYWTYRDADTIGTYGVIEGRVQTSSDMTGSEINKIVNEFIRDHRQPKTSVRIQASELAHITGERMDRFFIGDLMRLALPDYGLTVELNITSIMWSDVYNNPNSISIQLGEEEDTVVTFLHNLDATGSGSGSSSGRGGGGAAGKEAESWSVYKSLTDEYGKILKEAGIYLDANGTLIYAQDTEQNLGSRFNVTAEAISAEVERASNAETNLSGRLNVTAEKVEAEVTRATRAEGTLSGRITVEAGKINQIVSNVGADGTVTAASICLAINSGGSSATINAGKIYLLGQTITNTITADYIGGKIASLANVNVQSLTSVRGGVNVYSVGTTSFSQGGVSCYVPHGIWALQITQSGNTYTLQRQRFSDDGWVDVGSFSRAVSSWGVGGGSGKVNVTAYPQNQTKSVNVSIDGTTNIYSNGSYTYTVDYENLDGDDVSTGYTKTVNVSVSSPTPSNPRVSSSASGTSLGTLSGASPGKHILFNLGSKVYDIFLV